MFFLPTDMKTPGEISPERISEASVDDPAPRPWKTSPVAASNSGPRTVVVYNSREPAYATLAVPCIGAVVVIVVVVDELEHPAADTTNARTAIEVTAALRQRDGVLIFASITDFAQVPLPMKTVSRGRPPVATVIRMSISLGPDAGPA
jgi:hypothetical protein